MEGDLHETVHLKMSSYLTQKYCNNPPGPVIRFETFKNILLTLFLKNSQKDS